MEVTPPRNLSQNTKSLTATTTTTSATSIILAEAERTLNWRSPRAADVRLHTPVINSLDVSLGLNNAQASINNSNVTKDAQNSSMSITIPFTLWKSITQRAPFAYSIRLDHHQLEMATLGGKAGCPPHLPLPPQTHPFSFQHQTCADCNSTLRQAPLPQIRSYLTLSMIPFISPII